MPRDRIRPTVIIGLGGTGKQVLMEIRRRFFDRYGGLKQFPSIAYLYMDTNTNDLGEAPQSGGQHIIHDATELTADERVSITVTATAPYVDQPQKFSNVSEWFYPNLRDKADLTQGAGAIRPYGRLAFFHNYDRSVYVALQNVIGRVRELPNIQKTRDSGLLIDSANTLDVFIVASLAGGTGSGTLLDTVFAVKQLAPDANRYGFILLPPVYGTTENWEVRYANGYAALKEINHYTYRADANQVRVDQMQSVHDFRAQWSMKEPVRHIPGPPFHYLYLIDGKNEAGLNQGADGTYNVVADGIFYEFAMSEFGSQKRSVRDNTDHHLCGVADVREDGNTTVNRPQPKHYSGFGIARITFPVDQVRGACGALIAQKVVARWNSTESTANISAQDVKNYLEGFLKSIGMADARKVDAKSKRESQVLSNMGKGKVTGKSLKDDLTEWLAKVRKEALDMASAKNKSVSATLRSAFEERELATSGWESDRETEWRELAWLLQDNLQSKQTKVLEKIDEQLGNLLADPARGLGYAKELLKHMGLILSEPKTGYIDFYTAQSAAAKKQLQLARNQWVLAVQELDEDGDRMSTHPWRTMTVRFLAKRAVDILEKYFQAKLDWAVYDFAGRLCQQLKDQINGKLPRRLDDVKEVLAEINKHLKDQEDRFTHVPHHDHQIILFDAADLPGIYKELVQLVTSDGSEEEMAQQRFFQVETELVRSLAATALNKWDANLFKMAGDARLHGIKSVADSLLKQCEATFGEHLKSNPKYEAMKVFVRKFPEKELQQDKLEHIFQVARSWVHFRDDYPAAGGASCDYRHLIVGRYRPLDGGEAYDNFDQALRSAAGVNPPQLYRTDDNRHEIVIYSEVAGYPLFLLSNLQVMRERYNTTRERDGKLHIDQHESKFADLIPRQGRALSDYRELLRNFALGQALGVLQIALHPDSKRPMFILLVERGFGLKPREEHLGYEDTALDRLEQHPELREALVAQVTQRNAKLHGAGPEAMAAFYAVLSHYIEAIYPSHLLHGQGGAYEYENPMITAVLEEEIKRIEKMWSSDENWRRFAATYIEDLRNQRQIAFARLLAPEVPGVENRVAVNF